jgi:hypothetical protein
MVRATDLAGTFRSGGLAPTAVIASTRILKTSEASSNQHNLIAQIGPFRQQAGTTISRLVPTDCCRTRAVRRQHTGLNLT